MYDLLRSYFILQFLRENISIQFLVPWFDEQQIFSVVQMYDIFTLNLSPMTISAILILIILYLY